MDLFEMMAQDVVEDTPDRSKELQDELDIIRYKCPLGRSRRFSLLLS